jgi:hypothetical protein
VNNVASSMSQQNPRSTRTPTRPETIKTAELKAAKATLLSNATAWADRALSVASNIKPPERTVECDIGCAVATHNLGEILEMQGQKQGAKKRYEEAWSLSKAIGFEEGVQQANSRLKALKRAGV